MDKLMWRNQLNAILGLLVIIIPWLGFPRTIIAIILTIIGLLIFIFSAIGSRDWYKNGNNLIIGAKRSKEKIDNIPSMEEENNSNTENEPEEETIDKE